jgi:hypothetical protein
MASGSGIPGIASAEGSGIEAGDQPHRGAAGTPTRPQSRRRVQHFKRAERWFGRFVRLVSALHEGFWLGCLSADDLNAITAEHYQQSREYSSLEHNQRGLFEWEVAVLNRYFSPGTRILVAAAGGGREVLGLRRAGFQADGFECSTALVQASGAVFDGLGEARGVVLCAADEVPAGPQIYSGLVVGWSAYTHIPTRARRIRFLQNLRERALPNSPLLLSFFSRDPSTSYETLIYRMACVSRFLFRGRNEAAEMGDHLSWCYSHTFVRGEIEAELRAAGFRPVHFSEVGEGHAVGMAE